MPATKGLRKMANSVGSLLTAALLSGTALARSHIPIVEKDVVVVGGGAAGTYSAVRLREDFNVSVVLIERGTILGGHTNTYDNPDTGLAMNFGVQTYMDYMGAIPFFERFGIPTVPSTRWNATTVYIDPDTGKLVPNVTSPPPISASIEALKKYLGIIAPWDDIMLPGYWNFPAGDAIPADLLLPFPDFAKKYDLEDVAPVLARVAGIDINSNQPALYVVMNFGTPVVQSYVDNSFFNPSPLNNSLVYGRSEKLLGKDLLLSTSVISTERSEQGVRLLVQDQRTGAKQLICAKRLLIAAQPSLSNLATLALDEQETAVFSTWRDKWSFAAIVKTNFIPDETAVTFVAAANATQRPYSFGITWLGQSNHFRVLFSARQPMDEAEARAAILAGFQTLADGGEFAPLDGGEPSSEVVAIASHTTVGWQQTVEDLRADFMQQLYALQGRRSTWYTGGLWCPDYSSNVWAFSDTVIPRLLEGI